MDRHTPSEVPTRIFRQHPDAEPARHVTPSEEESRASPAAWPRSAVRAQDVKARLGQTAGTCPVPAVGLARDPEGGQLPWGAARRHSRAPAPSCPCVPRELGTRARGRGPSGGQHAVTAEIRGERQPLHGTKADLPEWLRTRGHSDLGVGRHFLKDKVSLSLRAAVTGFAAHVTARGCGDDYNAGNLHRLLGVTGSRL